MSVSSGDIRYGHEFRGDRYTQPCGKGVKRDGRWLMKDGTKGLYHVPCTLPLYHDGECETEEGA